MIIEGKYPNSFYNNFLIPLAVDNMSLHQNTAKILLGLFSLSLTYCLLTCSLPSLGSKKIDKTGWGIADSLEFQEKNRFPCQKKTYR